MGCAGGGGLGCGGVGEMLIGWFEWNLWWKVGGGGFGIREGLYYGDEWHGGQLCCFAGRFLSSL